MEGSIENYKGVMVFCEEDQGQILETGFEMVSEARRLADETGGQVSCVVIGGEGEIDVSSLGGYGADVVYLCQGAGLENYSTDDYTRVMCRMVEEIKPEILLFCATHVGRDLAPRCAARLGVGLTADCTRLDIDVAGYEKYLGQESSLDMSKQVFDYNDRLLKMTRPAFGGHLMATIVCPRFRPCMSTVRPGVMQKGKYSKERAAACKVVKIEDSALEQRVQVMEVVRDAARKVDFTGAQVIVSVGRGIARDIEKGMALAKDLAKALGDAPIGGSRAVIDSGWLPADQQIGQTGKTVRPRLYVALGISGAMQHLVGMKDSDYILAVNKNPNAHIFGVADYAICGDLFKVVPMLTEEILKLKQGL